MGSKNDRSEVTDINKQKFIAELSRLLSFMYEKDQQLALSMYASLFDDANNEQELLEFLESPTRQAVMLARAYNAKERKLRSHVDELYRDEEEVPVFLEALERMRQEAENRGFVNEHTEAPADSFSGEGSVVPAQPAEEKAEEASPVDAPAPIEVKESEPKDDAPESEPFRKTSETESPAKKKESRPVFSFEPEPPEKTAETEKRVSIPLAVLYSLFAIPVTIALCVVLLAPAFLSLGLCIACAVVGFKVLAAAFGGFYMFSDIIVVLGCGLIVIALGLLFLWIFVWFVGGAIAGVINGAIALGNKWCSKEVPVE